MVIYVPCNNIPTRIIIIHLGQEALKGRKMVFRAFSTPSVWFQYKRGLSSPPVFFSAFQAYACPDKQNYFLQRFPLRFLAVGNTPWTGSPEGAKRLQTGVSFSWT